MPGPQTREIFARRRRNYLLILPGNYLGLTADIAVGTLSWLRSQPLISLMCAFGAVFSTISLVWFLPRQSEEIKSLKKTLERENSSQTLEATNLRQTHRTQKRKTVHTLFQTLTALSFLVFTMVAQTTQTAETDVLDHKMPRIVRILHVRSNLGHLRTITIYDTGFGQVDRLDPGESVPFEILVQPVHKQRT